MTPQVKREKNADIKIFFLFLERMRIPINDVFTIIIDKELKQNTNIRTKYTPRRIFVKVDE